MPLVPYSLGALDVDAALGLDNFLGARRSRSHVTHAPAYHHNAAPSALRQAAAAARAQRVAALAMPDVPGVPERDAALLPAGFPVFAFTNATGINTITQTTNVQTQFRGQRLSVKVLRAGAGGSQNGIAPLLMGLQIGMKPIVTTPDGVPMETFDATSFDTNLLLPPTTPGTIYKLSIALSGVLTAGDTITCFVSILGTAVL